VESGSKDKAGRLIYISDQAAKLGSSGDF